MEQLSKRKLEILNIALKLFASKGYNGTSMNEIAENAGIKKASLYSHFESKENIFKLLMDSIIKKHEINLINLIDSINEDYSIKILEDIFYKYIEYCKDNFEVDFWTRFYYFPPLELKEYIHDKTHSYEKIFEKKLMDIIDNGIKKNEIKNQPVYDIMLSYYYLLLGFVMSLNDYEKRDPKKDIQSCISVFLNGIKI